MPEQEIPQEILDAAARDQARKELLELGFEASNENIENVIAQQNTAQHPAGFDEVLDKLEDPDALRTAMQEKGVTSIVHTEGRTVWDHARLAITQIDAMDVPDAEKHTLKIIMLFHDLGKSEVAGNEENTTSTQEKVAKGELHQSMIGHAEAKQDEIRAGLAANGLDGQLLDLAMTVIQNHMKTSLLEQHPKQTVKLFDTFGTNEEERRRIVELLTRVLQVDGNATERIDLQDGELRYSKNEKKLELNFEAVWAKYEEGRTLLAAEDEKKKKAEAEKATEITVFGKPLSEYSALTAALRPGRPWARPSARSRASSRRTASSNPWN